MADEAFSRTVINARERPLSSDINQLQSEESRTLREALRALFLPHNALANEVNSSFQPVSGFLGDGFFVAAGGALTHTMRAGLGLIYDAGSPANDIGAVSKVDDRNPYYPVYLSAPQVISSPAAPGVGLERLDIIEVALDRRLQDSSSRDVLDTGTGVFTPTLVLKTLAYALDGRTGVVNSPASSTTGIGLKAGTTQSAGTFAGSGGVTGIPATTAGYTRVAVILVTNTGAVVQGDVRDDRVLLAPNGVHNLGVGIVQVPGSPNDVITLNVPPTWPAGFRIAARQLNSPSNGGSMRIYIVGGNLNSASPAAVITASCLAATLANANRLARMTPPAFGTLSAGDKAALVTGGASTPNLALQVGQGVLTFDIDGIRTIDGGDPTDANRQFQIQVALTNR